MKKPKVPKKVYKQTVPNKERLKIQKRLLMPFLKKYDEPILVHATHNSKIFNRILDEGKIKLPKQHDSPKISPYMEKFLGINNTIYYSLGFVYVAAYDFKFGFIFDLKFLKELEYYRRSLGFRCYRRPMRWLFKYDRKSLEDLKNVNPTTKKIVENFMYNKKSNGKRTFHFPFWIIEKHAFKFIMNHKKKKQLIKIIKDLKKNLKVNYPYSMRSAKKHAKDFNNARVPEILGFKNNNLLKNPYFLGFYIREKLPKALMNKLKKKYSDKILFDGRKIKKISDIK
jgi:hypothetical protein